MYNILESWWWSFSFQFFMVCSMRSWLFCCRWPLLVFLEWLWMQFLTCRSPCCQICHRQRRRRTFLVWLKTRWVRGSRNGTFSSITWPKRGTLEIKTRRTQLTRENFYLSFLGNTRKRNFHFKTPFFSPFSTSYFSIVFANLFIFLTIGLTADLTEQWHFTWLEIRVIHFSKQKNLKIQKYSKNSSKWWKRRKIFVLFWRFFFQKIKMITLAMI